MDEQKKKLWVFFDEFNTTDEQAYIKEMIIEHKFMGRDLPSNIAFIAACNPYRVRGETRSDDQRGGYRQIEGERLAFKVNPPPDSMVQLMWDYQQLRPKEMEVYIAKIIRDVEHKHKKKLIGMIVKIHEWIKEQIDVSAVSLRDIERFRQLFAWFEEYLDNLAQIKTRSNNSRELRR